MPPVTYLEQLGRLEEDGAPFEPGSEEELLAVERFQDLLADFKAPGFAQRIPAVYASDVFFNDTLKTVLGAEALQHYLAGSAAALESGKVEFLDWVVREGNYYFRWKMSLRFKRVARGRTHVSFGMSHVRFDREGKVALHQDFWDSAGGLFEHLPGVGWMIRRVKDRL